MPLRNGRFRIEGGDVLHGWDQPDNRVRIADDPDGSAYIQVILREQSFGVFGQHFYRGDRWWVNSAHHRFRLLVYKGGTKTNA